MNYDRLKTRWQDEMFAVTFIEEFQEGNSIWKCDFNGEFLKTVMRTEDEIVLPFFKLLEPIKPHSVGVMCIFGEKNNLSASGIIICRGDWHIIKRLIDNLDEKGRKALTEDFYWNELKNTEENQVLIKNYFEADVKCFSDGERRLFKRRLCFK